MAGSGEQQSGKKGRNISLDEPAQAGVPRPLAREPACKCTPGSNSHGQAAFILGGGQDVSKLFIY